VIISRCRARHEKSGIGISRDLLECIHECRSPIIRPVSQLANGLGQRVEPFSKPSLRLLSGWPLPCTRPRLISNDENDHSIVTWCCIRQRLNEFKQSHIGNPGQISTPARWLWARDTVGLYLLHLADQSEPIRYRRIGPSGVLRLFQSAFESFCYIGQLSGSRSREPIAWDPRLCRSRRWWPWKRWYCGQRWPSW